jgi:23S rRNA pseudouridine1911/1915/1917 synthase
VSRELRELPVPEGLEGVRVDQAVARMFGLSRTVAAELIGDGEVTMDGDPVVKSTRATATAWLSVLLPEPPTAAAGPEPELVDGLTIVYADDDIAVVEKPVGVAAHSSPGWSGPTVIAGLAGLGHRISVHGPAERQGVVHRLDVGTSGLMVVAKSERAYSRLKRAFKHREVDKRYRAVVQGHPDPLRGTIDAPIDRHPGHVYKWAVMASGRASVTHYDTVEAFPAASLVDVQLQTGRTHQIRVHFSALRHPCVGDLTYGADPTLAAKLGLERQWLHAYRLGFVHPGSGEAVEFRSEDPPDLAHALRVLRGTE